MAVRRRRADHEALGPGIDADGSYGAADFVSWYDGHPDFPRTWPLEEEKVAVIEFQRPEARNALNPEIMDGLEAAFDRDLGRAQRLGRGRR